MAPLSSIFFTEKLSKVTEQQSSRREYQDRETFLKAPHTHTLTSAEGTTSRRVDTPKFKKDNLFNVE